MGFDIMSLQRGRGPVQARSRADEGRAVLKYIDVEDLVPSEDNFYSMSAIEELAGLIELSGGVKQPGLVTPLGGGKYKVISGHRRRLASILLVKQGKEAYRKMPCIVEDVGRNTEQEILQNMAEIEAGAGKRQGADADKLRAINEAILIITTNGQREKTDWDKVQETMCLRALLEQKRQFEKIPGETRKLIAEWLGTTPAQVGRYDSIEKHLIPAFKTWLEEEKINISVAYELSTMSEQEQLTALDRARDMKRGPSIDEVKRLREELRTRPRKAEPEPPKAERDETPPAPGRTKAFACAEFEECEWNAGGDCAIMDGVECPHGLNPRGGEKDAGKIVNFPAPDSPPPSPRQSEEAAPEPERDIEWAALMLKTLRNYCETMAVVKGGQTVPWSEYAEAVDIAIAVLRK